MDAPLDTLNYMIAGFAVIFGVMAVYAASIVLRFRRLREEETLLEEETQE